MELLIKKYRIQLARIEGDIDKIEGLPYYTYTTNSIFLKTPSNSVADAERREKPFSNIISGGMHSAGD